MASNEVKIFDINNYKPPSFPWFKKSLITPHKSTNTIEKGLLPLSNLEHEKKFFLLQYSLPPYFNPKYHNFNLENYIDEFKDDKWKKYVSITSGCLLWHQELGFHILEYISSIINCDSLENNIGTNFGNKMDNLIALIHYRNFSHNIEITDDDLCQNSIDFLFDECILVQLPWKPTLFYQWLFAAWAECLIIERETIVLRHWKIPESLGTLVTKLLELVKQLRGRIILGFIILHTHSFYCDKSSDKFERNFSIGILDNVLIPSLPILEYITSGDAMVCIRNIKTYICTNDNDEESKICVQSSSYKLNYVLDTACCSFGYNFRPWLCKSIPPLFRIVPEKIENLGADLNHHRCTEKESDTLLKDMSVDELNLIDIISDKIRDKNLESQTIKFVIQIIKDHVIKNDLVPGLTVEEVEKEFTSVENHKRCKELFDKNIDKSVKHKVIQQALMFNEAKKYLIGMHNYDGVIIQILGLQLEILEQEQLIRLAHSCSIIFNLKTKLHMKETLSSNTVEELLLQIKKVNTKVKKQKRESFWLRFPKKWREPVNILDKLSLISNSNDDIEAYITESINKIGQIVVNYAKDNLDTAIPMELYFDHVNVVHYILPSVIYIFAIEYAKNENNKMYFQTVQELINLYQFLYVSRNTSSNIARMKESSKSVSIKNVNIQETINYIKISKGLYESTEQICNYVSTKVENNEIQNKLLSLIKHTRNWQDYHMTNKLETYKCILFTVAQWSKFVYVFMYNFNFAFKTSFKVPEVKISEDQFSHFPRLNELYFTSASLLDLSCIYDMLPDAYKTHKKLPADTIDNIRIAFKNACQSIFCTVMNEHKNPTAGIARSTEVLQVSGSESDVVQENEEKKWLKECMFNLHNFYKILKLFKETHGTPPITLQLLPYIYHNPEVKNIVMLFLKGEFMQIETMLPIFGSSDGVIKVCRKCKKKEMSSGKPFLVCEKCVEQKYPDRNFFCGKRCKFDWWKEEHMAEHLEYELGLGDFSTTSVSDE